MVKINHSPTIGIIIKGFCTSGPNLVIELKLVYCKEKFGVVAQTGAGPTIPEWQKLASGTNENNVHTCFVQNQYIYYFILVISGSLWICSFSSNVVLWFLIENRLKQFQFVKYGNSNMHENIARANIGDLMNWQNPYMLTISLYWWQVPWCHDLKVTTLIATWRDRVSDPVIHYTSVQAVHFAVCCCQGSPNWNFSVRAFIRTVSARW